MAGIEAESTGHINALGTNSPRIVTGKLIGRIGNWRPDQGMYAAPAAFPLSITIRAGSARPRSSTQQWVPTGPKGSSGAASGWGSNGESMVHDAWENLGTSAGNRSGQRRRAWIEKPLTKARRSHWGQVPGIPGTRRSDAYQGAFRLIY